MVLIIALLSLRLIFRVKVHVAKQFFAIASTGHILIGIGILDPSDAPVISGLYFREELGGSFRAGQDMVN